TRQERDMSHAACSSQSHRRRLLGRTENGSSHQDDRHDSCDRRGEAAAGDLGGGRGNQRGRLGGRRQTAHGRGRESGRCRQGIVMATNNIFSGLKVVDFASFVAGPGAAVILSDFGADVIKVEPPNGDTWRIAYKIPPLPRAADNYPWHLNNRNKRGLAL